MTTRAMGTVVAARATWAGRREWPCSAPSCTPRYRGNPKLVFRCYERGSVLITSIRPVMEWDEVYSFVEGFPYDEQVVAAFILDRLLHAATDANQRNPLR